MSVQIHPTAVVSSRAEIAEDVVIGPYAVIEDHVVIGRGTRILAHSVLEQGVHVGERNRIGPFAHLGGAPQDLKYRGEPTGVRIGDDNIIREYVTIHRATGEGAWTVVGSRNYLMAYAHVAHNCVVGNEVIVINAAQLAGHVEVQDFAVISGLVGVHQYTRIGRYAMIGGATRVSQDVPPFVTVVGNDTRVVGLNLVGLKRRGFTTEEIRLLKQLFRTFFLSGLPLEEALQQLETTLGDSPHVQEFIAFVRSSRRGVIRKVKGRKER
ncbi:MAG: acyl-ACP--UDP-N-acetylglucosamine O-acyltransferase [Candidatus Hydrothermae bacterium]|nr:acyl-ACP--UDP-N-acetylglucosamine O-acyltransferase [Candidatus Hydrothermae bacterium]